MIAKRKRKAYSAPFIFLLSLLTTVLHAQTLLTGIVTDEKGETISNALVSALNSQDSSLIDYTMSDGKGKFGLKIPADRTQIVLTARCLGFASYADVLLLAGERSPLQIVLKEQTVNLDEVNVLGKYSGIRHGNDTTTYDVKVFADGTETTLGEVLNKMPGINVDSRGNVRAHGKDVGNILFNGIDHFSGNVQLATKNISADIAEKVEVLHDYGEYSLLDGFKTSNRTAINIGVAKNKLGKLSGDVTAGGGIQEKLAARLNIMQILPQYMLSWLGGLNNNGEQLFSMDDYFQMKGGMNEVFGKDGSFTISADESRLLSPSNNTYQRTSGLGSVNFSHQKGSSLKINAYLLYFANSSKAEDYKTYRFFLPDDQTWKLAESSSSINRNNLQSVFFKCSYNADSTTTIAFNGSSSLSNMRERYYHSTIEQESRERTTLTPFKTLHELMLLKKFGKQILTVGAKLQVENTPSTLSIETDTLLLPIAYQPKNDLFFLTQDKRLKNVTSEINASLLLPVYRDYYLKFGTGFKSKNGRMENLIYNDDNRTAVDSITNYPAIDLYNYYNTAELVKNKGIFRFNLGFDANIYRTSGNIQNMGASTHYYFFPKFELSFNMRKSRFRLNLKGEYLDSPIEYFNNRIMIDSYKSYKERSMMTTLFNRIYTLNGMYSYFDQYYGFSLTVNGFYQWRKNTNTVNIEQNGIITQTDYISLDIPNRTASSVIMLTQKLGFIPWTLDIYGRGRWYSSLYQISSLVNNYESLYYNVDVTLASKYDFPLNGELAAKMNINRYQSDVSGTTLYRIEEYGGKLKFKLSSALYTEVEFFHIKNRMPSELYKINLLNASLRYDINKKIALILKGNNLLHLDNYTWHATSFYNNYQIERQYGRIPGYIV
ncbi:MAG: TonB-dependent receptor, partial [Tannerella sp.]|nr:TonB-dependent receptor [Tannerella sp.]